MLRPFAFLILAALLLLPVATLAQISTLLPENASALRWHTIVFQYAKPGDVLKLIGIGGTSGAGSRALPPGVARIFVVPGNNSLLVDATDDGFNQVQNTLIQILHIAPDRVRLKVVLAAVPKSKKIEADFSDPNVTFSNLEGAGAKFYHLKGVTVEDNAFASFSVDWLSLATLGIDEKTSETRPTLSIQPIINDNYMMLTLGLTLPKTMDAHKNIYVVPIRDDSNLPLGNPTGRMTIYKVPDQSSSTTYDIFLFITPSIVEASVNDGQAITLSP